MRVKAKCVINATGPYTDVIRQMDDVEHAKKICQPSSGVHIVLPNYYRCHSHSKALQNNQNSQSIVDQFAIKIPSSQLALVSNVYCSAEISLKFMHCSSSIDH